MPIWLFTSCIAFVLMFINSVNAGISLEERDSISRKKDMRNAADFHRYAYAFFCRKGYSQLALEHYDAMAECNKYLQREV